MQMNLQKPEPLSQNADGSLQVVDVWNTVQGEGPLVGTPAVFVRLSGCNLKCQLCDTDYTSVRKDYDPDGLKEEIVERCGLVDEWVDEGSLNIQKRRYVPDLVVITGGEPFRQNIAPLVRSLLMEGFRVQVETNGTVYLEDFPWAGLGLSVVCSPKTVCVHPRVLEKVDTLKYVVEHAKVDPYDMLPISVLGNRLKVQRPPSGFNAKNIFIQPLDVGDPFMNKLNMEQAVKCCLRMGYRLSIQTHKVCGLK